MHGDDEWGEATAMPRLTASEARALTYMRNGASVALCCALRHVHTACVAGRVPALWDERVVPLCAANTPVVSFLWDGSMPSSVAPTPTDVSELVDAMVERLRMKAPEVVIAMVLLETLMVRNRPVLQLHSTRPILLTVCSLACKLTRDTDMPTGLCAIAMQDLFTALTPVLAARLERQLLEYLDWRIPNDPKVYRRHTLSLLKDGTPPGALPLSIVDVPWVC